eukprot:1972413-Amphidinium_carterae.1
MNASAEELNAAQEALARSTKQRRLRLQMWAVCSARLQRGVGASRLAKTAPYFERQRRLEGARRAVERATQVFFQAAEASLPENRLVACASEHAACLARFHAAQQDLHKVGAVPSSTLEAVAPYFEAEEEHRTQLNEADRVAELLRKR